MIIDLSNLGMIQDTALPAKAPGQTYDHVRIVHVPSIDRKFRTKIHYDHHEFQAWYVVEVWNGLHGWQEVVRYTGLTLPTAYTLESGYVPVEKWRANAQACVEDLVAHLQSAAYEIVG